MNGLNRWAIPKQLKVSNMDWLFHNLDELFRYISGFLIAWGFFATYTIIKMAIVAKAYRGNIRKIDALLGVPIFIITILFVLLLFVFTSFVHMHMIPILVFQFWYTMFVCYFTVRYLEPCIDTCDKYNLCITDQKGKRLM